MEKTQLIIQDFLSYIDLDKYEGRSFYYGREREQRSS